MEIQQLHLLVATEGSSGNFEKFCDEQVEHWELLHRHGISNNNIGISRATYYRRKKWRKCSKEA